MKFVIEAACGCNTGKIRRNNQDNFYFNGKCLEVENDGLRHPALMNRLLDEKLLLAIFDGMGGENFGEEASFAAARTLLETERELSDYFISEKKYLKRIAAKLNDAVVSRAGELLTNRMGSTMVSLYFTPRTIYVCNLGDSRAYRLRCGEFMQISRDHIDSEPRRPGGKPPLTQHLGIDPEDMIIEPYISKGELKADDQYLICSDGLTDMLTNFEISEIMIEAEDVESCVSELISSALEHGGKDNVTAIVCKISKAVNYVL